MDDSVGGANQSIGVDGRRARNLGRSGRCGRGEGERLAVAPGRVTGCDPDVLSLRPDGKRRGHRVAPHHHQIAEPAAIGRVRRGPAPDSGSASVGPVRARAGEQAPDLRLRRPLRGRHGALRLPRRRRDVRRDAEPDRGLGHRVRIGTRSMDGPRDQPPRRRSGVYVRIRTATATSSSRGGPSAEGLLLNGHSPNGPHARASS